MNPQASKSRSRNIWSKIDRTSFVGFVVLILLGLWIYGPALHGGWLWDDSNRLADPVIRSADGYGKVWTTVDPLGNYYPLTALAFWFEWRLWGDNPLGYHLVSVALHITSGLLLWRLFYRLGFSMAWVGALLFLSHPLMVESVAWVSELKNTLSLPPLLLALLAWLEYDEKNDPRAYRLALLGFIVSLAAKTSGVMLPFVLVAYTWWKRGSISSRDWRALLPFFAVALAAAVITLVPPPLAGSHTVAQSSWGVAACLASVGWTALFLLGKCFFPLGLMADYPGFEITHVTAWDVLPWLLLGITALLLGWCRSKITRPILFGLGFFLLNLAPVLLYVGRHYLEMLWSLDHLVYLPIIGLIGWCTAWLGALRERLSPNMRPWLWGGIAAVLLVFCEGSHAYAALFAKPETFWTYMAAKEPWNWHVHDDLGVYYRDMNRNPEALAQFQKAVDLTPSSDQPYFHLAEALAAAGKTDEAKARYLQAMQLNPHELRSYLALAGLANAAGNFTEAENFLNQARLAAPEKAAPLEALASLYAQTGRTPETLPLYQQAVAMDPEAQQVRYNYGVALLQAGDFHGAVEQLQAAVNLDGNFAASRENLGVALAQTGDVADAIEQFQAALKINPGYVAAHDNLGLALAQTGHLPEAIEQFQQALALDPTDAKAQASLSKLQSLQTPTGK